MQSCSTRTNVIRQCARGPANATIAPRVTLRASLFSSQPLVPISIGRHRSSSSLERHFHRRTSPAEKAFDGNINHVRSATQDGRRTHCAPGGPAGAAGGEGRDGDDDRRRPDGPLRSDPDGDGDGTDRGDAGHGAVQPNPRASGDRVDPDNGGAPGVRWLRGGGGGGADVDVQVLFREAPDGGGAGGVREDKDRGHGEGREGEGEGVRAVRAAQGPGGYGHGVERSDQVARGRRRTTLAVVLAVAWGVVFRVCVFPMCSITRWNGRRNVLKLIWFGVIYVSL